MRSFLMTFIFLSLFSLTSLAVENADPSPASVGPQQAVKAVESCLNGISTLRARFVQTANDGKKLTGIFYLKRPGKMRFQYDPPDTDFIVADGLFVYYYDGQMKQQSNAPVSNSLANFFLRKNITLGGDISVSDVRRVNGMLQMALVQTRNPLAGSLILTLTENPLQLRKWQVVDAQGLITEVALQNIETGITLDNDLFHYYDPALKAGAYKQN